MMIPLYVTDMTRGIMTSVQSNKGYGTDVSSQGTLLGSTQR